MTALPTKARVGLEMLDEFAGEGEFGGSSSLIIKILGNIVANPAEPKFRKLRTTNDKIKTLLATKGARGRVHRVRALLIGAGFVEETDALNAEGADAAVVQATLEALQQLVVQRSERVAQKKEADMAARNEQHKIDRENREAMKARIADDTTMRKEPGWKAQAAGCKESSKSITSAGDLGIGKDSGG